MARFPLLIQRQLAALWLIAMALPCAPAAAETFLLPSPGNDIVGKLQMVDARYEDTLPDIARRYDLGYNEITAANAGVDIWLPGKGMPVLLPTKFILPAAPREGIVLNVAAMRLFYYPKPREGQPALVITYPVGIGRQDWQTPLAVTRVSAKIKDPVWYVPKSILNEHAANDEPVMAAIPPGPDNPLGKFALQLALPGYLIHGTNRPWGVGMRVSHGCVRLYPEDIEQLFKEVPEGTPVRIVNQPYLAGWLDGILYLQAYPPLAEERTRWGNNLTPMVQVVSDKLTNATGAVDWEMAVEIANEHEAIPLAILKTGDMAR